MYVRVFLLTHAKNKVAREFFVLDLKTPITDVRKASKWSVLFTEQTIMRTNTIFCFERHTSQRADRMGEPIWALTCGQLGAQELLSAEAQNSTFQRSASG